MHRFNFNLCKSAARLGVLHGTRGEPAHPARPGRSGPAPPRAPPERGPAAAAGPAPGAGDKRRFPFLPLPPASPGRVRPEKPPPLPRVWRHWPPPRCARPPQLPAEGRGPGCAGAARERAVPCRAAPPPGLSGGARPAGEGERRCTAAPSPPLPGGGSATSRAGAGRRAGGPRSAEARRVGGRRGSGAVEAGRPGSASGRGSAFGVALPARGLRGAVRPGYVGCGPRAAAASCRRPGEVFRLPPRDPAGVSRRAAPPVWDRTPLPSWLLVF